MENRVKSIENRVDKLEERADKIDDRQMKIETEQAETRVYVRQIFERIDDIKLFMKQRPDDGGGGNREWIGLVKWIIGGTIFIIVAAMFTGGKL